MFWKRLVFPLIQPCNSNGKSIHISVAGVGFRCISITLLVQILVESKYK